MEKTDVKKFFSSKNVLIGSVIVVAVILIIVLFFVFNSNTSKKLELSDFERIAIYGYLEDYLSLDKLLMLSGESSYDELQYTQGKIKQALDSYYETSHEEVIPVSVISSLLQDDSIISINEIDYHGILVSDYEYLPEEDAFRRVEGANSQMYMIESQVLSSPATSNNEVSIKDIQRQDDSTYLVSFNILDTTGIEPVARESGTVTIKIVDDSFDIDSCYIF